MRLPALLLLLVSLTFAQAPQGQAPEPPKKARIEGIVVSLTGEPIARAQVRLQGAISVAGGQLTPGASFGANTDDAGKFTIEEIEPGSSFQLTAQRPGFVTARYGARSATSGAAPISLEAGQVLKGVKITMTPQGVIAGRVLDPAGDPRQNTMVALMRRGYQRGVRQMVLSNTVQTNDQGEFRIANLAPGRYYVVAQDRSVLDLVQGAGTGVGGPLSAVPTYYPNGTDPQSAAPLDVAAGQEVRGIEIKLRQARAYSARGKVLGPNGGQVPQPTVLMATPKNSTQNTTLLQLARNQVIVRPDGAFELRGLIPGSYTVMAVVSQPTNRMVGQVEINIMDSDAKDLVVPLGSGGTLSGSIRLDEGDIKTLLGPTPADAQTSALSVAAAVAGIPVSGGRPAFLLTDALQSGLPAPLPPTIKEDGSFTMEGIAPGRWLLNFAGLPAGTYVKSVKLNGGDVTHSDLDFSRGAGGTLEIVLSKKAGDVNGSIVTEKNESTAGYMVSLWTRDPDAGQLNNGIRTATTDQSGSFKFPSLAPGIYYAAAWEEIDGGLAQARDFVNLETSDAVKLEVGEGSHISAQIHIVPVAKIKAAEEKLP